MSSSNTPDTGPTTVGRGSRPVTIGVARGGFTLNSDGPAMPRLGQPQRRLPSKPAEALAAIPASTPTIWWVMSLDGGVGRSSVALALASILATHGGTLFVDAEGSPLTATAARLGITPAPASPATWAWAPRTAGKIHAIAGSSSQNLTAALAAYTSVVVDLAARQQPPAPGVRLYVARADEDSLGRLTTALAGSDSVESPLAVIINDGLRTPVTSRAKALAKALEGRADHVARLPADPGLAKMPIALSDLSAASQVAIAHTIIRTTHRKGSTT